MKFNLLNVFDSENKFWTIITIFILVIFLIGLITSLKFSDEIFHFWFAKDWYDRGSRPVYNALVDTVPEYDYYRYYVNAPLWHYGLKWFFNLVGKPSKNIASLYMTGWFSLLLLGTYLLTKSIYSEKQIALYSVFITATMPFFVAFSILFFIDMPIASITPFLIYFTMKRNYIIAGIIMGIMFLLKENSYFLLPACFLLLIYWNKDKSLRFMKRSAQAIIFLLIVVVITLPNFKFRLDNFQGILVPHDKGAVLNVINKLFKTSYLSIHDMLKSKEDTAMEQVKKEERQVSNYLTSDLFSLKTFFKYLGIIFPFLFIWKIITIFKYKNYQEKEIFIWAPVVIYIPLYLIAFQGWWEIRYLSPILPLLCIVSADSLRYIKKTHTNVIISLAGLIMFAATVSFTYIDRQVTPQEESAIEYVKQLPDGRILTPEELFISYYTGKHTLWSNSFVYTPNLGLYELLWGNSDEKSRQIIKNFKIRYILIPRKRVYDDTIVRHFGGYPKSFINKIKKLPYIEKIYSNEYASLWRVSL
jgi:4-amino-4-deoxy-L-arabinose transferase-like glycosyltransferase